MQASMDPPPAKAQAAAAVTAPPGKPEKATRAAKPTTLLDVQEVEWITRELERLLAREQKQSQSHHSGGGDDAGADGRHRRRKRARLSPAPAPAAAAHKDNKGCFLADLLGKHAVSICSGDGGAVDHGSVASAAGDRGWRRRRGLGSFREVEKV